MLTSLFFAAAAVSEPSIAERFGLEWKNVALQAFSFLVLFAVMYYKGIKPTIAAMDERREKIDSGLKYAEQMQARLAAAQQAADAQIREAQQKAQLVVAEAQKAAKEFADRQQKEAVEKSAALLAKAHEAIELEKKKMLAEARTEIARLVILTTERVLAKQLSDADRAAYNDSAARELSSV